MRSQDETLADAVGRAYGEAMVIQNQLHRGDMTKDEAVMAKLHDWSNISSPAMWTPVRTFTVRDDPILVEGWFIRAKRLRGASKRCPRRVRFRGKAAYDENSSTKAARWKLTVRAGGRTVKRFRGKAGYGTAVIDVIACTKARKFGAALVLTDPAGHSTPAPAKSVQA